MTEIYEFTDYVESINSEGEKQWLCPSKKMARPINNTGLVKVYEFYEAVNGSCQNQIEAIISQEEWDRVKQAECAVFLFKQNIVPCDAEAEKRATISEDSVGNNNNTCTPIKTQA